MKLPTIPGYTQEDLASLTPEELSALESDSGDNEEELTAIASTADGEVDTGVADPAAEVVESVETPDDAPAAPAYTAAAPEDATTQLDAMKAAKATAKSEDKAALKKLMDGEIDFAEYEAIKDKSDSDIDAANESIASLKAVISKAEISAEMTAQETARAWTTEVSGLMTAAKTEGFDYKGNEALNKELNGLVRAFGQEATEQGMTDDGLKASKWALKQAHDVMKMRHADLVKTVAKPVPAAGAPRHTLTTLNNMPNADRTLGDNDAISKFASLEGDDLERAMASMSKAEVEKLMASV